MKKKSKKNQIALILPRVLKHGNFQFFSYGDEIAVSSPNFCKKIKSEFKTKINEGIVTYSFFNKKENRMSVHSFLTVKQLETFVKEVKARQKKSTGGFWCHLNPELAFFFTKNK